MERYARERQSFALYSGSVPNKLHSEVTSR